MIVVGLSVAVYAATGLEGDVYGSLEGGTGDIRGSFYYTVFDRTLMTVGAGGAILGTLIRIRR